MKKGKQMYVRSGKIQFLFWTAFFSVIFYLWIVGVGLQTFILPDELPLELPHHVIMLLFVLYILLALLALAGTIVSTMIDNTFYMRFFSSVLIVGLATLVITRGMFG